jgi:hypothetical protein
MMMKAVSWFLGVGATLAVLLGAPASAAPPPPPGAHQAVFRADGAKAPAPEFGVSVDSALTTPARGMVPESSSIAYGETSDGQRYTTSGSGYFGMSINLPSGAGITGIELAYCNEDPSGYLSWELRDCPDTGACTSVEAVWSGYGSPGTCGAGYHDITPVLTVANGTHSYDLSAGPSIASNLTRFRAGRILYHLQVSPAPGTATFGDVPTNYWAFQYIEALAASGITSGCGGGNFCPTTPVTRDQMAVFLAKALGLQWAP